MARFALAVACLVLLPVASNAQGEIAGVVRDTPGAVLPVVAVEAASPTLLEQVRTAVTDEAGRYRVVELRPGVYAVTFAVPGFNTLTREGIELTANFTATVNAEMYLRPIEEPLTVTGATPVVDVQSVTQRTVMTRDVLTPNDGFERSTKEERDAAAWRISASPTILAGDCIENDRETNETTEEDIDACFIRE